MSTPVVTMLNSTVPVVGGAIESPPPPHAERTVVSRRDAVPMALRVIGGGLECLVYRCSRFWSPTILRPVPEFVQTQFGMVGRLPRLAVRTKSLVQRPCSLTNVAGDEHFSAATSSQWSCWASFMCKSFTWRFRGEACRVRQAGSRHGRPLQDRCGQCLGR